MQVSLILKQKPSHDIVTTTPTATLAQAADLMAENKIGALVVLDQDRIAGILSERDIVRSLASSGHSALDQPVRQAMTETVKTCAPSETAFDVLGRMTEGRFRHMPVVDAQGTMTGFLSIGDVVKARLDEIEQENAAMADMLSG